MTVSIRDMDNSKILTRKYDGKVPTKISSSEIKDADGITLLTYRLTVHQLYQIFVLHNFAYVLVYAEAKLAGMAPLLMMLIFLSAVFAFVLYRRRASNNAKVKAD